MGGTGGTSINAVSESKTNAARTLDDHSMLEVTLFCVVREQQPENVGSSQVAV